MTIETGSPVPAPEETGSGAPGADGMGRNTCSGCDARWNGTAACHCCSCHASFSGVKWFDLHRSADSEHGMCLAPGSVTSKGGKPLMEFRDGMWRGPAMTEAEIAKAWGEPGAA